MKFLRKADGKYFTSFDENLIFNFSSQCPFYVNEMPEHCRFFDVVFISEGYSRERRSLQLYWGNDQQ